MDTVTVTIETVDSNIPDTAETDEQTASLSKLMENPLAQASVGILVLFVLMGMLILRGRGKNARSEERRRAATEEMMLNRGVDSKPAPRLISESPKRTVAPAQRDRSHSMFKEYRRK
jgi:hypothetical protein